MFLNIYKGDPVYTPPFKTVSPQKMALAPLKAQLQAFYKQFENAVNDSNQIYSKYLDLAVEKTKVSKIALVSGLSDLLTFVLIVAGLLVVVVLAIFSIPSFCDLISLGVGGIYPAYQSVLALLSKNTAAEHRWLTFWVIAAVFLVLDFLYGKTNIIYIYIYIPTARFFNVFFLQGSCSSSSRHTPN